MTAVDSSCRQATKTEKSKNPCVCTMSLQNVVFSNTDAFQDDGQDGQSTMNQIHLRIQQRNGRKCITLIQGLPDDLDLKKILKALKKVRMWLVVIALLALLPVCVSPLLSVLSHTSVNICSAIDVLHQWDNSYRQG